MAGKTSYAKAVELAATKRGKYEKQLEIARRSGDRFGINSAERSIARITQYEQELFDSQEQQKIDKGITPPQPQMGYGGNLMYGIGGPLEGSPFTAADFKMTPSSLIPQLPYKSNPSVYTPIEMNPLTAQHLLPSLMPNFATPSASAPMQPLTQSEIASMRLEDAMGATSNPNRNTFLDQAKTYAPYAAQFATDLYALNQLKNIEGPVDAPMQRATQINTDLDTSATRARLQDNMRTFNAGVDSSMSNSAAVQNVKLANLAQSNRQLADIGQQEANSEMSLRNQQSGLLTDNINTNMALDATNKQRQADFSNMITNARMGIIQGMGVKGAQVGSEFAQRKLDKETLDITSRQFDKGLLNRQFSDMNIGADFTQDPEQVQQMINLLQDPTMGEQFGAQLQERDPKGYQYLMSIINSMNQ